MPILGSVALFYTMTNTLLWGLPGVALAAPAPALCGRTSVDLSFSFGFHALPGVVATSPFPPDQP